VCPTTDVASAYMDTLRQEAQSVFTSPTYKNLLPLVVSDLRVTFKFDPPAPPPSPPPPPIPSNPEIVNR